MIAGHNGLSNHNVYVDWCIRSHRTLTIHSYWVCVRCCATETELYNTIQSMYTLVWMPGEVLSLIW